MNHLITNCSETISYESPHTRTLQHTLFSPMSVCHCTVSSETTSTSIRRFLFVDTKLYFLITTLAIPWNISFISTEYWNTLEGFFFTLVIAYLWLKRMRNQRNTSVSMKHKLQFYLHMPYPLLSTSLPSVKRVSLFLSECLGKRSFNVNWTPSMKQHLCTLRALCHCAARGHAHPRGREAGSGMNVQQGILNSGRGQKNASVRPVQQLWLVMRRETICRHWTVTEPLDSQPKSTDWVEFDCNRNIIFSLPYWAHGYFASLTVESQNRWDFRSPPEFTIT